MSEKALIRSKAYGEVYSVTFADEALALKAEALEASALIGKVTDAETQEVAVAAQTKLATVIRAIEKARQDVKRDFIERGKLIDVAAKEFVKELDEEGNRVTGLVQAFQEKERIRIQAEARLTDQALSRLEREKNEKLACAEGVEEQDAINEEYSRKEALASTPPQAIPRARGQITKPDWEVTVSDIHSLYRSYPNCVDLKPRVSEIKALLSMGITPRGVIAKPIVRATVRTAEKEKAIET